MSIIQRRFYGVIASFSVILVALITLIIYFLKAPATSAAAVIGTTGLLGIVFLAANIILMGRLGGLFSFDFLGKQNKGGEYKAALAALGRLPMKIMVIFFLDLLVFLLILFSRGSQLGLQANIVFPLFWFILSLGSIHGTCLYVFSDQTVSNLLFSHKLTVYPADLRESRQKTKNMVTPTALVLLALCFGISLSNLINRINATAAGKLNTWALMVGAIILFLALAQIQVLIWARSNGKIFSLIIAQLEQLASAEKDFTKRVSICSVDELSTIAGLVNTFCDALSRDVGEIKGAQGRLSEYGNQLGENAEESAAAVKQISANIENVRDKTQNQSASVIESSSAVQEIAKNIESLDHLIGDQSTSVTQSSASIEQMVSNIGSINTSIEKMAGRFMELSKAAVEGNKNQEITTQRVGKIIERSNTLLEANGVIAKIASQTNLLAMNAAIEAAHAGSAGLGFTVVADEIRHLAETSTRETKNIKSELAQVRIAIDEVVEASKASSSSFTLVSGQIDATEELVRMIQQAMQEQQEGIKQIMEALKRMNEITYQVRTGSREMSTGNSMVLEEMNRLQNASMEIKNNIDEMARGSTEVTGETLRLSELAGDTRKTILQMERILKGFKVE